MASTVALQSRGEGALRAVFGNWPPNPIVNAYSPTPFNPNKTSDDAIGSVLRPNQTRGVDPVTEASRLPVGKRFNPDAFAHSKTEHGNLGRNSFCGFSLWQVDLGLRKRFSIAASVGPQIRGELFNLLETPNFARPLSNQANALFGWSTQTLNRSIGGLSALYQIRGPRSVQLGLRPEF